MSKEMERLCDNEVTDLIRMSAIVEIVDYSKGCLHAIFAVQKKSIDLFRPIVNLMLLNKCIR